MQKHKRTNKQKEIKCYMCNEHIDRGACDNDYAVLTLINNRPIPIKKTRRYICSNCLALLSDSTLFKQ